jgi:hypothetical protein
MMPCIFLKGTPSNIIINVFGTCVVPLWFANINMQSILDPYTTTSYCTSYMIRINKSIKLKFHFIIQKCKIDVNIKIQKCNKILFQFSTNVCPTSYLFSSFKKIISFITNI